MAEYSKQEILDAAKKDPKGRACQVVGNIDSKLTKPADKITQADLDAMQFGKTLQDFRNACKTVMEGMPSAAPVAAAQPAPAGSTDNAFIRLIRENYPKLFSLVTLEWMAKKKE